MAEPVTVQFNVTLALLPVAVRHTVAPPPLAQLCACARGAAQSAAAKRNADDTCFMVDLFGLKCPAGLSPALGGLVTQEWMRGTSSAGVRGDAKAVGAATAKARRRGGEGGCGRSLV